MNVVMLCIISMFISLLVTYHCLLTLLRERYRKKISNSQNCITEFKVDLKAAETIHRDKNSGHQLEVDNDPVRAIMEATQLPNKVIKYLFVDHSVVIELLKQ